MKYVCVDRGSDICPCHLMSVGKCYTCSMIRDGICSCGEALGWQGVCPYGEFIQGGEKPNPLPVGRNTKIVSKHEYSKDLTVVRVEAPIGMAERSKALGAYFMAEALGHKVPLSVLRAGFENTSSKKYGLIEFAVKPEGPKTNWLLGNDVKWWRLTGPFYNGLINSETVDYSAKSLIIAKGSAIAPFILMKEAFDPKKTQIFIDKDKLTDDFIQRYVEKINCNTIRLANLNYFHGMKDMVKSAAMNQNVLLLVSPYYVERLTEELFTQETQKAKTIIYPNPANLCCGLGICGSCSHVDKEGVTVKMCKCNRRIMEQDYIVK